MTKQLPGIKQTEIDKVIRSDLVKVGAYKKAVQVQDYWKSISPVFGDKPPHRKEPDNGYKGEYRDSIVVKDYSSDEKGIVWRVKPTAHPNLSLWIEFGTRYRETSQKPGGSRNHGRGLHTNEPSVQHMQEYALVPKVKSRFRDTSASYVKSKSRP